MNIGSVIMEEMEMCDIEEVGEDDRLQQSTKRDDSDTKVGPRDGL